MVINLRGNTKNFEASTQTATGRLGQLKAAAMSATPALGATSAAMGVLGAVSAAASAGIAAVGAGLVALSGAAIAAGGALLAGGLHQMGELDSLGDAATKIGIGTEALAGFRHAAGLAGVESASLDKALVKMQRNLSEAAAGGGKAGAALADLGLDAAVLKSIGPEEAFQRITQAIDGIPSAADRAAISMDVFGKAGADLLPLIAESGELGEKIKEASEIGLAATQAQVAEVGAANDALDTMKSAFKGLFRTVSISIAPFVQEFSEGVTNVLKRLNTFRDSIVSAFRQIQFVLENFGEYWNLAYDKALLKLTSFYNDVENIFVNTIPTTFMEGVKLAFPAFDALTDYIAYSLTKIVNQIEHFMVKWGQVMERLVSFDFKGAGEAFDEAVAGGKERMEGAIEKMLRQDSERSAAKLDKLMGDAAKKIGESFNRSEGPIEAAMRQAVESKTKQLGARMDQFVDGAMSALKVGKKKKSIGEEDEFQRSGHGKDLDNKAVERGTQEALKLITGKAEDKTLKKMDETNARLGKVQDILKVIAGKPGIARANV